MQLLRRRGVKAALLASLLLLPQAALAGSGRAYPSAEAVKPLEPGAPVPSAMVRTIDGREVNLAKLVHDEGALLVFYRGGW